MRSTGDFGGSVSQLRLLMGGLEEGRAADMAVARDQSDRSAIIDVDVEFDLGWAAERASRLDRLSHAGQGEQWPQRRGCLYDPMIRDRCRPYPVWKRLRDEEPLYYNEKYDFYA